MNLRPGADFTKSCSTTGRFGIKIACGRLPTLDRNAQALTPLLCLFLGLSRKSMVSAQDRAGPRMPVAISCLHASEVGSLFFLEGRPEWCTSFIFGLLKLLEPLNPFLLLVVGIIIIITIKKHFDFSFLSLVINGIPTSM